MLRSKRIIAVVGAACLFLSLGASAQTAQGKPGGGTSGPQDVNVVNTPTVNIGTGGPIGVDVLTLPPGGIVVAPVDVPKPVFGTIEIPVGQVSGRFTYTPATGKRVVIKSILVSTPGVTNGSDWVTMIYSGGSQPLAPLTTGVGIVLPDTTIALPSGPFSIEAYYSVNNYGRIVNVLISLYELD